MEVEDTGNIPKLQTYLFSSEIMKNFGGEITANRRTDGLFERTETVSVQKACLANGNISNNDYLEEERI
jgi:hypothetical protein